MKTTLNIKGATLVAGVPEKINTNASGRLTINERYRILGYANVKGSGAIPDWVGVALEKVSTGGQIVVGVNTMLGTSIVLQSDGSYKISRIEGHPFSSPTEFASKLNEDNNTIFVVSQIYPMEVNEIVKPKSVDVEEKYLKLKSKDFYQMEIVKVKESV